MCYKNFLPIHYFEDNIFNQMTKNNQKFENLFQELAEFAKKFSKITRS